MKRVFTTVFALAIGAPGAAAQSYTIDTQSSQVTFVAKGKPGFLKIEGEGAQLTGTLTKGDKGWVGQVDANLVPIKTGIDLRDEHMHEKYLETGKFPAASLKISNVKVNGDNSDCTFTGVLTVKDVGHDVAGDCAVKTLSPSLLAGSIEFEFDLEKYPVGVPSYLGVTVASTVKVEAAFSAQSKSVH